LLLLPGFGGGLTYCAHLLRWGARTTPLAISDAALPPNERPALELLRELNERKLKAAPPSDAPFG
jgi:3-oxoacyl-[acyl-carrier-protein] synthase III